MPWIVFDWGGVLIEIADSWNHAAAMAGVAPSTKDMAFLYATPDSLGRRFERGELSCEAYFSLVAAELPEHSIADVEKVHRAFLVGEYDGAEDLVNRIHARGHTTALLSNTNEAHFAMMATCPGARTLKHKLASHLLGENKPDAAIYRRFQEETGCRPSDIVFFDDRLENVEAARAAGWQAHPVGAGAVADVRHTLVRLGLI